MGRSTFKLALILVQIMCVGCLQAQTPRLCTKHLKIQQSTQHHWNPGVVRNNAEQAGGEVYEVTIKIKKGGYVTFKNLIIENQSLDVEVKHDSIRNASGPFKKGDEVVVIARTNKQKPMNTVNSAIAEKIESKNAAAAVVYTQNDKMYIHTISDFVVTQNRKSIQ